MAGSFAIRQSKTIHRAERIRPDWQVIKRSALLRSGRVYLPAATSKRVPA
jgi:hypothetical protein